MTFRELHEGFFVMPNPWDAGSARLLEAGIAETVDRLAGSGAAGLTGQRVAA